MFISIALATLALKFSPAEAALCPKWAAPEKAGDLDSKIIDESSGMARSRKFDVIYHTNDSGVGPEFYVTRADGSSVQTVKIENFKPLDPEEIGVGPCPEKMSESCVVMADIGDNLSRRKSIALFFIEERAIFPKSVKPAFIARFKYPDGAHNAEAMAVLPDGSVVIFTKEMSLLGQSKPSQVFRAPLASYVKAKGEPVMLEKLGELDITALTKLSGYPALITAMTVTADAKRFALLTYGTLIEFAVDLSAPKFPAMTTLKDGIDFRVVPIAPLPQQESVTYDKNDRDLFYSTEVIQRLFGFGAPAPLMKMRCAL